MNLQQEKQIEIQLGSKSMFIYRAKPFVIINRNFSGISDSARNSAGKAREVAIHPLVSICLKVRRDVKHHSIKNKGMQGQIETSSLDKKYFVCDLHLISNTLMPYCRSVMLCHLYEKCINVLKGNKLYQFTFG